MFILFSSYRIFSFDQNRNFRPFFTTVPNLKNFHRQLSEIYLIEMWIFQKFRGYKIAICACAVLVRLRAIYFILSLIAAHIGRDSVAVFSSSRQ